MDIWLYTSIALIGLGTFSAVFAVILLAGKPMRTLLLGSAALVLLLTGWLMHPHQDLKMIPWGGAIYQALGASVENCPESSSVLSNRRVPLKHREALELLDACRLEALSANQVNVSRRQLLVAPANQRETGPLDT